jgi:hypothetical protein
VGFAGRLQNGGRVTRLRPADVRLTAGGARSGTVERRVPVEDGVRLQLADQQGTVIAICPAPGPEPGETIHYDLTGGLHYDLSADARPDSDHKHQPTTFGPASSIPTSG